MTVNGAVKIPHPLMLVGERGHDRPMVVDMGDPMFLQQPRIALPEKVQDCASLPRSESLGGVRPKKASSHAKNPLADRPWR